MEHLSGRWSPWKSGLELMHSAKTKNAMDCAAYYSQGRSCWSFGCTKIISGNVKTTIPHTMNKYIHQVRNVSKSTYALVNLCKVKFGHSWSVGTLARCIPLRRKPVLGFRHTMTSASIKPNQLSTRIICFHIPMQTCYLD